MLNYDDYFEIIDYLETPEDYNAWLGFLWKLLKANFPVEAIRAWSMKGSNFSEKGFQNALSKNMSEIEESEDFALNTIICIAKKNGYNLKTELKRKLRIFDKVEAFDKTYALDDAKNLLRKMFKNKYLYHCSSKIDQEGKSYPDTANLFKTHVKDVDDNFLNEIFATCKGHYLFLNQIDFDMYEREKKEGKTIGLKNRHVISFDFTVIECDALTIDDQFAILHKLDLPCFAVVHSGNKSLHCYFHVGAKNIDEYEARVLKLHHHLNQNGFITDVNTKNLARGARFPFAHREDKNGFQYIVKIDSFAKSFQQWDKFINEIELKNKFFIKTIAQKKEAKQDDIVEDVDAQKVVEEKEIEKYSVNLSTCRKVAENEGFFRSKDFNAETIFFRIKDQVLNYCDTIDIFTAISDFRKKHFRSSFFENVWMNSSRKINDKFYHELENKTIDFHFDTRSQTFLYFKNCYVEITKDQVIKRNYLDDSKNIFLKSLQKEQNFEYTSEEGDFSKFISNLCNDDAKRIESLRSILGYLISRHKDESKAKAIIFTDENMNSEAGGTGKSLLCRAISQVRNLVTIDMKKSDPSAERFMYSVVNRETNILEIEDPTKRFDFKNLFVKITGDFEVEVKGKSVFSIPFDKSPKICITSNYVLGANAESVNRRKVEFEIANFYNAKFSPADEFGRNFFSDWDEVEYNKFFAYMIKCCQIYLSKGIVEAKSINIDEKRLIIEYSTELLEFFRDFENDEKNYQEYFDAKTLTELYIDCSADKKTPQKIVMMKFKKYFTEKNLLFEKRTSSRRLFILKKGDDKTFSQQVDDSFLDEIGSEEEVVKPKKTYVHPDAKYIRKYDHDATKVQRLEYFEKYLIQNGFTEKNISDLIDKKLYFPQDRFMQKVKETLKGEIVWQSGFWWKNVCYALYENRDLPDADASNFGDNGLITKV